MIHIDEKPQERYVYTYDGYYEENGNTWHFDVIYSDGDTVIRWLARPWNAQDIEKEIIAKFDSQL